MRLSDRAIEAINNSKTRQKIAIELEVIETSVRNYIKANEDNGELTKASVLQIIEEETGLNQKQILVEETI